MSDTIAIETRNLTKTFGRGKRRVQAIANLELKVAAGQVYGFLGPNGAGKTTTIRILLDLVRAQEGEALIFGQSAHTNPALLRRVGALVEGATFYPFLTGRRNLEVLARTEDVYDAAQIQRLIDRVGMGDHAHRRTGGYSTGMKQRLGVAAALLGHPELIILDEPTNGLDPAGIQEMRVLVRELVEKDGKTVFLSSHMLNEVEQICDRVAIIQRGAVVREGTVSTLLAEQARLRIDAAPLDKAAAVISERWHVTIEPAHLHVHAGRGDIPAIARKLVEADVDIYEIATERQTLEDYFLAVTSEDHHVEPAAR